MSLARKNLNHEENKFLHHVATPIANAVLVLENLIDDMTSSKPDASAVLKEVRAALSSLEEASAIIHSRREVLNERETKKSA